MGSTKIHEIAKKLGLNSKEVLNKAKELGIDVKSHLSGVTDEQAATLEKAFNSKSEGKEVKTERKPEIEKNERRIR